MGTVFAFTAATNPSAVVSRLPPEVGGVSWVLPWSAIQPSPGTVDWPLIDSCLSAASATGRVSMLRVIAGEQSPAWLPEQVRIRYAPKGPLGPRTITMPVPWRQSFLAAWVDFIHAYGARYDGHAGLAIVQMPGAGHQGEMSLPEGEPTWASLGYSDFKVVDAWTTIIDAYLAAFPRVTLALDLGEPLSGSHAMMAVHDYALAHAPAIALQENGLRATMPRKYPDLLTLASAATVTGWQAWGRVASGAGPLAGMLATATASRASYLEIYAADCHIGNAAALAHWALTAPSLAPPFVERRVALGPRRVKPQRRTGLQDRRHG